MLGGSYNLLTQSPIEKTSEIKKNKRCPEYNTKLQPVMRSPAGEFCFLFRCLYSQVRSDLEDLGI